MINTIPHKSSFNSEKAGDFRVAVVHEWLLNIAGSEKVVAEILRIWPHADLYSVVDFLSEKERETLQGKRSRTTFVQKLPMARRLYKSYLPLMPLAIEQLDLTGYDLIISSNHAVAKGVITGPDQLHVSYVHSPMRYAWDLQHDYLRESGLARGMKSVMARWMLHRLRTWDHRTAAGVDDFVANSRFIARRIQKVYRRAATVIHPPVDIGAFCLSRSKRDFYLTASRLVPYKRVAAIVEAFAQLPERQLVVIGDGSELARIRRTATSNVRVMGYQPFSVLRDHMQAARAFIFAAEEDFGIAPVEAQACGTPVIAFGKGGVRDSVRGLEDPEPTGLFFDTQSPASIREAVHAFEKVEGRFNATSCRRQAENFSAERFRLRFRSHVEEALRSHASQASQR